MFPEYLSFELCPHLLAGSEKLWDARATWNDSLLLDSYLQCKVGHRFAQETKLGFELESDSEFNSDGNEIGWNVGLKLEEDCEYCRERGGCDSCETEFHTISEMPLQPL